MISNPILLALGGVLIAAIVTIPRLIARQYCGLLGRSYGLVVGELYFETERRAALIGAMADAREQRLERLERRLEQNR